MADKYRRTAPLNITFADGERPSAVKLSALSTQYHNALGLVEKAIGDIWSQGGDQWLDGYPLQIANLARMIGESKYQNPAIYCLTGDVATPLPLSRSFQYTENLTSKYGGKSTGYLLYKPVTGAAQINFTEGGGNGYFTTLVASEHLVLSAGQYYINTSNGYFRTYSPIDSASTTTTLTYPVCPTSDWNWDMELVPGVIPDLRQTTFTGCRIEQTNGKFFLLLPPRQPLTLATKEAPLNYPPSGDWSLNKAIVLSTSDLKFWQSSVVNAIAHEHYRYSFPTEIRTQLTQPAGTVLPDGFLYLFDLTNRTIIENVVFKIPTEGIYSGQNWVLEVSSTTYNFTPLVTGSETEANYSASNLGLITVGAPIHRALDRLTSAFLSHEHGNTSNLSTPISHSSLKEQNPPVAANNEHSARYPTYLSAWPASYWNNDDHTSLLSRAGSQGTLVRDANDNAMLGDLILASSVGSGGIFLNNTSPSRKLIFGTFTGPYINAPSGTALAFFGSGGTTPSIGIGTASPTGNLHINAGAADATITLESTTLGTYDQSIHFKDPSEDFYIGNRISSPTNGFGIGRTTSKNDLVIDSNGLIGINTIVATARLHVASTVDDTNGIVQIQNTTNATGSTSDSLLLMNNVNGTSQVMQWQNKGLRIGTKSVVAGTGDISFTAGSDSVKMFIQGSTGYVGINQIVPTRQLHIVTDGAGVTSGSGSILLEGAANTERVEIRSFAGGAAVLQGFSVGGTIAAPTATVTDSSLLSLNGKGYDGTSFVSSSSALIQMKATATWTLISQPSYIKFTTTPTGSTAAAGALERMRIADDGVVSIGTVGQTSSQLSFTANNGGAYTYAWKLDTSSNFRLLDITAASATRIFIDTGGSVGIGNAAPTDFFHVSGGARFEDRVRHSDGTAAAPTMTFTSNTATGFYAPSSGTVGVTLNGVLSYRFNSTSFLTVAGLAATPALSFLSDTDTGTFNAAANALGFSTGGTERVRIDSSGNVGIANTSPSDKLDVTGDIRATGGFKMQIQPFQVVVSAGGTYDSNVSGTATTGHVWVATYAGSLMGISVYRNNNAGSTRPVTAGSVNFQIYKNGSAVASTIVSVSTGQYRNSLTIAKDLSAASQFAVNDVITIFANASGGYTDADGSTWTGAVFVTVEC